MTDVTHASDPRDPRTSRERLIVLRAERDRISRESQTTADELQAVQRYLGISGQVTEALDQLTEQLFQRTLDILQDKLTIALAEVLEQPIRLIAKADDKFGAAAVEFWIERDGNREHIMHGLGGSVANILSVGLRMFALTSLDEREHRRFLVLDEQDCWLRPDLVPRLVKIVHSAGKALGFQVLMISHHDVESFRHYADRIVHLTPRGEDGVHARVVGEPPQSVDSESY